MTTTLTTATRRGPGSEAMRRREARTAGSAGMSFRQLADALLEAAATGRCACGCGEPNDRRLSAADAEAGYSDDRREADFRAGYASGFGQDDDGQPPRDWDNDRRSVWYAGNRAGAQSAAQGKIDADFDRNYELGLIAEPRQGRTQAAIDGHRAGLQERVVRQAAAGDFDKYVGTKAAREYAATGGGRS